MQPSSPEPPRTPIPNHVKDPLWSLGVWPVAIRLGGAGFEIPALPARDWLAVLMVEDFDPADVFPDLAGDLDDEIAELILAGTIDLDDLDDAAFDVISAVSGRPWWIALRLIATARASWAVLGPMMIMRVDAGAVSLSAWLDVLLMTIMESIDRDKAEMFVLQLEAPPPDDGSPIGPEAAPEPEMTAAAFMAMAG